jgi:hypothetical protein
MRCFSDLESDWKGEGAIDNVASRLPPLKSGFDNVAVKGNLRGEGSGNDIGISIDNLHPRQLSVSPSSLSTVACLGRSLNISRTLHSLDIPFQ